MCGYSTTSYPRSDCAPAAATTPFNTTSPEPAPSGGRTVNVTVVSSSSRTKWTGADAGSICQPAGAASVTVASAAAFPLLATVTLIFRLKAEATGLMGGAEAPGFVSGAAAPGFTTGAEVAAFVTGAEAPGFSFLWLPPSGGRSELAGRSVLPVSPTGNTAMSGSSRTLNGGTTCSCDRFSPASTFE